MEHCEGESEEVRLKDPSVSLSLCQVFYDEFSSSYQLCSAEDGEDPSCSNACSPFGCTSVVDHLTYLNVTMSHLMC